MKAPKEIASKAERYKELKKEIDKLYEELEELYLNVRIAKKKMNMIIQNSVIYVDTRQIGIMKY